MAKSRSHLLYTKSPEGTEIFKYSKRGGDNNKKEKSPINPENFRTYINRFESELAERINQRNLNLDIPANIICVDLTFWSWFNSSDFDIKYRTEFGLTPIKFTELNTKVLFGVVDEALFKNFIQEVKKFILATDHIHPNYNPNIRYIKEFKFHTTNEILTSFSNDNDSIYLNLINNVELDKLSQISIESLKGYLNERKIDYTLLDETYQFELREINEEILVEIANNYDVVHSVNSHQYMVTKPGTYGTNIKEYPFTVGSTDDNLPIIGIIDTGVSAETPLENVLINDPTFGINGLNPFVDEADDGFGHGTSVAALASFGSQFSGTINKVIFPDAYILSIKVLADFRGKIVNSDIAKLITRAHNEHSVKIFNLTICYSTPLKNGEVPSDYAFILDKLAFELDILICVCTANHAFDENTIHTTYPNHFLNENANICTPADSMNSLTIGAIGDNLEEEMKITAAKYPFSSSLHPALYTSKFNLAYDSLTIKNRNVIKPDIVFSGGNYTCINHATLGIVLDSTYEAGLQVLSASKLHPIIRGVGTSYATPLVANLAAKISFQYNAIKPQTIKALIINSSEALKFGSKFGGLKDHHKKFISGYGKPKDTSISSTDNEVTIIFENSIEVGTVKSLPVIFPEYLNSLTGDAGILKVEATLCYRFLPIQNNHLAYCPVNIAFGFFRNVPLINDTKVFENGKNITKHKGISGGTKQDVALSGVVWSQDALIRSKMLSNTQKLEFKISKSQLIDESNVVKIAVQCHFHKILPEYIFNTLPTNYEYSLVVRISENSLADGLTNRLYTELKALNQLELFSNISLEGDADASV